MKRIVFIDIAKAICIILVVIGHFVPDNSPEWYVTLHGYNIYIPYAAVHVRQRLHIYSYKEGFVIWDFSPEKSASASVAVFRDIRNSDNHQVVNSRRYDGR